MLSIVIVEPGLLLLALYRTCQMKQPRLTNDEAYKIWNLEMFLKGDSTSKFRKKCIKSERTKGGLSRT